MSRLSDNEAHMSIDARTAVPAAVWLCGVVDSNCERVRRADFQRFRQVQRKACVAVFLSTEFLTVQVDGRVAVNPIKLNAHALASPSGRRLKRFPIPADTAREKALTGAARIVLVRLTLDAPIVREIQLSPRSVRVVRRFRTGGVTEIETPVVIRTKRQARLRLFS